MESYAASPAQDASFLELILRDPPLDPLSILVLVAFAGFVWLIWRNLSFD